MKIKWYGHSAFQITTEKEIRIIIDPYESGSFSGALSYGKIEDQADIVLTSHDHADHNYTKDIKGKYNHISKAGDHKIKDIKIKAIPCFHDSLGGKKGGSNLIFVITADGLNLVHMGDIGHSLDQELLKKIGKVDILLLPVGGFFTVDAVMAQKIMNDIKPSITVPMHYKTEKCNFPITPVENFTKNQANVRILKESSVVIKKETLPKEPEIIILQHAL
ncbi:MAG: MBL fold metallo-hydrolase [Smithellaceae bacterium]|jgi:L-ascorbate metabolism protein UlaG (beta-lactamase superfamily)